MYTASFALLPCLLLALSFPKVSAAQLYSPANLLDVNPIREAGAQDSYADPENNGEAIRSYLVDSVYTPLKVSITNGAGRHAMPASLDLLCYLKLHLAINKKIQNCYLTLRLMPPTQQEEEDLLTVITASNRFLRQIEEHLGPQPWLAINNPPTQDLYNVLPPLFNWGQALPLIQLSALLSQAYVLRNHSLAPSTAPSRSLYLLTYSLGTASYLLVMYKGSYDHTQSAPTAWKSRLIAAIVEWLPMLCQSYAVTPKDTTAKQLLVFYTQPILTMLRTSKELVFHPAIHKLSLLMRTGSMAPPFWGRYRGYKALQQKRVPYIHREQKLKRLIALGEQSKKDAQSILKIFKQGRAHAFFPGENLAYLSDGPSMLIYAYWRGNMLTSVPANVLPTQQILEQAGYREQPNQPLSSKKKNVVKLLAGGLSLGLLYAAYRWEVKGESGITTPLRSLF